VDQQIVDRSYGRLFAVIFIDNRQFKVTQGDVVMLDVCDLGCPIGTQVNLSPLMTSSMKRN